MRKAGTFARDDGFTLVELMMVILIIGILVGIAVLSFAYTLGASKEAACKANLKILRGQVNFYYDKNRAYPASLLDLVPNYVEANNGLNCPQTGDPYIYDPDTGRISCPYHTGI